MNGIFQDSVRSAQILHIMGRGVELPQATTQHNRPGTEFNHNKLRSIKNI